MFVLYLPKLDSYVHCNEYGEVHTFRNVPFCAEAVRGTHQRMREFADRIPVHFKPVKVITLREAIEIDYARLEAATNS